MSEHSHLLAGQASEAKPDVVLLDLEMPGGGAEETMRKQTVAASSAS